MGKERCKNPETELKDITISHLQPKNHLQIKTKTQCKDQVKGMDGHFLILCTFYYME